MQKLVQINVVCNGSTGKIMGDLAKEAEKNGFETYCFFGRGNKNSNINCEKIGNKISIYFHVLLARLGFNGYGSYFATKKLVKKLKNINPDIIQLHNIHGYYINLKVLFKYLKNEYKGKIVWTLHDCWAFTGHCSYFLCVGCNKWQNECYKCPQLKEYPGEYFDTTKREFKFKKNLFTSLNNLTLVTPSNWLKGLVKKSFLKDYNIEVINNGIDLNIFKPTYDEKIYKKYNIPKDKKIILGVANKWETRKGLNVFLKLSQLINGNEIIILVGLNDKQIKNLPNNIIGIKRTDNQMDLVKIYTIADVFLNPTLEDNYPTVNLESIACGTPVITFNTGGSGEAMHNYGIIINEKENYQKILDVINNLNIKNFNLDKNVLSKNFMFEKYLEIYEEDL